jgi:hypothetical protein
VGTVFHRHETAGQPPTWLERTRQQAAQVKQEGEAGSSARMKEYEALEQQRLESLRQSEQDQREKDRRLFFYVSVFAIVVVLLLLAVGLIAIVLP